MRSGTGTVYLYGIEYHRATRRGAALLLAAVLTVGLPPRLFAHDFPNEIIIQAFVKPEGNRLHLLLRLPLALLLDMDLTKRADRSPSERDEFRRGLRSHHIWNNRTGPASVCEW